MLHSLNVPKSLVNCVLQGLDPESENIKGNTLIILHLCSTSLVNAVFRKVIYVE